jgi:hypothetical protein
MNKQFETEGLVEHQVGVHVGRRNLLKLTGVGVAVLSMMSVSAPAFAQGTLAWDKTFPKSERVDHLRGRCCSLRETRHIRASSVSMRTAEPPSRRNSSSFLEPDTSICMTA